MISRARKGTFKAAASAWALALCLAASTADAQDTAPQDLMPQQNTTSTGIAGGAAAPLGDPTHPALELTPDKSEIITLDRAAKSLIVGNPIHLNVLMDSTMRLILVPREPGATYFAVLDEDGKVIMQRHVLVAAPAEKYIRVRRSCSFSGEDCDATSVYYCPDICHPIGIMGQDSGGGAAAAGGGTAAPGGAAPGAGMPSETLPAGPGAAPNSSGE